MGQPECGRPLTGFAPNRLKITKKSDDENAILGYQACAKYVEQGTIKRHEFYLQGRFQKKIVAIKHLLFFLPDEEWRVDLYESLMRHLYAASWTDHLERIQSFLLGYPIEPRPPLAKK